MSGVWGDRFRTAADLALFGTVVTVAALPVVTAGAAFAAGSFAMAHFVSYDTWPSPGAMVQEFRRRLRPGLLLAGPAVALAAVLIWLDVRGLHTGAVPGGVPAIVAVLLAAAVGAGLLGLVVVRLGDPAARSAANRPATVAAAAGVVALVALLALLVHPVLLPALVGYAMFALHVVARRPQRDEVPGSVTGGVVPVGVAGGVVPDGVAGGAPGGVFGGVSDGAAEALAGRRSG